MAQTAGSWREGVKPISFKRRRFSADVIRPAVWLYFRFTLSIRDIEVGYTAIRCWALKFRNHGFPDQDRMDNLLRAHN